MENNSKTLEDHIDQLLSETRTSVEARGNLLERLRHQELQERLLELQQERDAELPQFSDSEDETRNDNLHQFDKTQQRSDRQRQQEQNGNNSQPLPDWLRQEREDFPGQLQENLDIWRHLFQAPDNNRNIEVDADISIVYENRPLFPVMTSQITVRNGQREVRNKIRYDSKPIPFYKKKN